MAYLFNFILEIIEKHITDPLMKKNKMPRLKNAIGIIITYAIIGALGYLFTIIIIPQLISSVARLEGIILDSVYTGKAMYGLVEEIKKGNLDKYENILFIHTGGIFGWTRELRGRV